MNKNTVKMLLTTLSDVELTELRICLHEEEMRRHEVRVKCNTHVAPTQAEMDLFHKGEKVLAIKSYRGRTGESIGFCKTVLENYYNPQF